MTWAQVAAIDTNDGRVRSQRPLDGNEALKQFSSEEFSNFTLSGDGTRLLCGVNGNTHLLSAGDGTIIQTDVDLPFRGQDAGFAPGSRFGFVISRQEARFYRSRGGRFLGARAVPEVLSGVLAGGNEPPCLSEDNSMLLTSKGNLDLRQMWKRGIDWDSKSPLLRRLDVFSRIVWSPRGCLVTFDQRGDWGYVYRLSLEFVTLTHRSPSPHPFRDIYAPEIDVDEHTLRVWDEVVNTDSHTPFAIDLADLKNWPYIAAWKWDLRSGESHLVWKKPVGQFSEINGIVFSPDHRIGAIVYSKPNRATPFDWQDTTGSVLSQTQLFSAREGTSLATIPLPFHA